METFFVIIGSAFPVIITVVITSIRLEHRLTKVETNLSWVMSFIETHGCGCSEQTEKDKE